MAGVDCLRSPSLDCKAAHHRRLLGGWCNGHFGDDLPWAQSEPINVVTCCAPELPKPKADDIAYAYECAADFLEAEEWPEDDGGAQVAAYREVAKRLRRAARRAAKSISNSK